jgi:putative oxidoreductase
MIASFIRMHNTVFSKLEQMTTNWLPGLIARLAFASVLLLYFWTSFATKISPGSLGFLSISSNAYYQILPSIIDAAGNDVANVAFFPWKIIVFLGTYTEFLLPLLIVIGLFTRLASLSMIGFIAVQSFVDINFHDIGAEATGALFDRFPDAAILDQRLLWIVPLLFLVLKGAGSISLDAMLRKRA